MPSFFFPVRFDRFGMILIGQLASHLFLNPKLLTKAILTCPCTKKHLRKRNGFSCPRCSSTTVSDCGNVVQLNASNIILAHDHIANIRSTLSEIFMTCCDVQ